MAKVKDILDFLEITAPVGTAMDFDNVGLLVGSEDTEVSRVLLSLDITPGVVAEAADCGCQLIVSHHPVIFGSLKTLKSGSAPYLLARHGIDAVCMHTNLDLAEEFGVNTCLAEAVGVKNLRKSALGECLFIGELEEAVSPADFARIVKDALSCEGLRYTDAGRPIKTVAVSSGSGGSEIGAAAAEHADALVTGEIKHHDINAANEAGVSVVEAGHFKSEDVVILPLKERLEKAFPDIVFTKSKTYGDKVKFL